MLAGAQTSVPPASRVVEAEDVRAHARIDSSFTDDLIRGLITVAEKTVEQITRTSLLTQTRIGYYRSVRVGTAEVCPSSPVQSISVTRYTSATTTEAVTPRLVPGNPAMWYPPDDGFCYELEDGSPTWTVTAVCGYAEKSLVPEPIRQAILLLCGHLYDHPELVSEADLKEVPFTVNLLLRPYVAEIY